MSYTPPVFHDGFSYANDSFFAAAGNQNHHRRATAHEIDVLFHPTKKLPRGVDKEPVGHWYEAQLLHYGLPPSKSKAVAKTRLLEALNRDALAVPEHIRKIEEELRKKWLRRDKAAKKSLQEEKTRKPNIVARGNGGADATLKTTPKRKREVDADKTVNNDRLNVNISFNVSANQKWAVEGVSTPETPKRQRQGGVHPGTSGGSRKDVSDSPRSAGGSTSNRIGNVGSSSMVKSPGPHQSPQTARRGGGFQRGRGRAATATPTKVERSFKGENLVKKENDYLGENDTIQQSASSIDDTNETGDQIPELGPLGLINGMYEVQSDDLDQWSIFDSEDFSLILCLEGSAVWGAYDFGMHSGILYLPTRPRYSSYQEVPFSWRGRENNEGQMSLGPSNQGWIRFLGDGRIEGMINCYGESFFTGRRISGDETRAPRDARSMRTEWDGYNSREYDREDRARRGGDGRW